jgi:mono/diheme cytochrome c family protein
MRGRSVYPTWQTMRLPVRAALIFVALACYMRPGLAAESSDGRAILERNCGRCHAVAPGDASPLKEAPNLAIVLGSYPGERLELELGEGIGSRHRDMPQIQFSAEEITSIYYYLHGKEPDSEYRRPQQ